MFPAALELAMAIGVPLALAVTPSAQPATRRPAPAPAWTQAGATVAADAIPEADHAYRAAWVAAHEQPVDEYMLSLFTRHDVVVVGEAHNLREHKDFVLSLMPRLYHEAGVRVIGWEFTNPSGDAELERAVTAPTFDYPAPLDFARRQGSHARAYKEHWDRLAEELLNALSKIDALKVAARTSAFSFRGKAVDAGTIARTLGVTRLLDGSIRRSGNRLRISVQLVNAADGCSGVVGALRPRDARRLRAARGDHPGGRRGGAGARRRPARRREGVSRRRGLRDRVEPLAQNGYKVDLVRGLVEEEVLALA